MSASGDYGRDFHATYSGSGIHRLLAGCYGSVRLARAVPQPPDTTYQAEGTAAHAELARCLSLCDGPAEFADSLGHVLHYINELPEPRVVLSERRVIFPQRVVPAMECSGTLDCMAVALDSDGVRHAWCIEYKHGAGEFVDAEENAQLSFYAWAALWQMDVSRITLVVVQPNHWNKAPPVREYETNKLELFDFATRVVAAIEQAERLHAPLHAGDHCKFCSAAPVCTARERTALATMTGAEAPAVQDFAPAELPKPDALDLARLGAIVVHAPAIRAWLKSVEDYAEARALAGEIEVPGCKIVEAAARRKWAYDMQATVEAFQHGFLAGTGRVAADELAPRKLIGITEAEKLVIAAYTEGLTDRKAKAEAKAAALEAFSKLTVKESTGAQSLVPLSDPRLPVNRTAKLFTTPITIIEGATT